jgi:hypothetical protein
MMQGLQAGSILSNVLTETGGNKNIDGDYSSSEGVFYYSPSNEVDINSLVIVMKCIADKVSGGFGGGAVLANSLLFQIEDDIGNVLKDLTNTIDIKSNDDLKIIVDDDGAESAKNFIGSRYYKAPYSAPIKLRSGERLVLRCNDNMTTRVGVGGELYFLINGVKN